MAYNLKEMVNKKVRFTSGHRMCAGCGAPPIARTVLRALKDEDEVVVSAATGCLEVSSCIFPYTSWKDASFIHSAFANAAATISGAETAYNVLKKKGKIDKNRTVKFITFGGDGGTYDIGLQSLSGAMERGHDMVYVCYDNGAYMNTGTQRSSATPIYADTTTAPAGKIIPGKLQYKKDLTAIMVKHNLPYVAQTAMIGNYKDMYEKASKAIYTKGPCFINALSPCTLGWKFDPSELVNIQKLAVDSCFWPLYEVENGVYKITYKPANKIPVDEFLKLQKRFRHLFKKGNEWMIKDIQQEVDRKWEALLKMEECTKKEESI